MVAAVSVDTAKADEDLLSLGTHAAEAGDRTAAKAKIWLMENIFKMWKE
jgi:hypothetical protein